MRVARVLERIEPGLRITKSFYRMRSSKGNRREIDILCEDLNGNPYVIEFKRFGVHSREVVGQIVEYMGMQIARGEPEVRGCIVVGDATEELLNARLIVKGLDVRTYRELLPGSWPQKAIRGN
jgi:RecB family endonuclease NucS